MRREQIRKPKRDPELALEEHLRALGLPSIKAYQNWCAHRGFKTSLRKHRKQLAEELYFAKSDNQTIYYTDRQRETRKPFDYIAGICAGSIVESDIETLQLRHLHQTLSQPLSIEPVSRDEFMRLASHAHRVRGNFFEGVPAISRLGMIPSNTFLSGLTLLAAYSDSWIRPPEQWKPPSYNPRRQFASLVRHLFDRHGELPGFFDSVWFFERNVESARRRRWCISVGAGHNIRQCDLPLPYTRPMSQHFLKAPASLTIDQALRWGQVLGLGGDERLAATILGTRLELSFDNDSFWSTVIHWLVENPMLDRVHVGPIIDYLHEQKFVPIPHQNAAAGAGGEARHEMAAPAQPNLSMKGRTADSLLRQVQRWHRALSKHQLRVRQNWPASGIPSFHWVEGSRENGNRKVWTIRELLSNHSLHIEGRQLKHCVASYASSCARGTTSIWTLEVETAGGLEKLLTVEVRPRERLICQARGKLNRRATEKELHILHRWSTQTGLRPIVSL